ncbi:Sacchrp-dh-NADP domain-containing protein [Fusarium keratoplasticum]|uniref:Sacchrp-dh-NADP domain-containing protein n=1 Tax=Fusarium keratoplasticum TaxID=1328300 RepID=A0ACC0RH62_9HYPO|nr:Sacchrp-dh-NADP domain-containing protein [Fusarium keratoplasticum]KAI8684239.1 Sacchrp-dh-NADP domain-containing protein [Fusarium keratoplasticum]
MADKIDIVLLGATGYTGRLCAAYMTKAIPNTVSWAIAGRNQKKLKDLQEELKGKGATCTVYALDLNSDTAIAELAQTARVIINTIGPYSSTCGTAVIKACAENGTDYVDCSGEMPWMQGIIAKYDETARKSGSRIVMTAGWGAVPADLPTYLAVRHIRETMSLPTREVLVSLDDLRGSFSGGSINSMCDLEMSYGSARIAAASAPFVLSPIPRSSAEIAKRGVLPAPNVFGVQVVKGMGALVEGSQTGIETGIIGRSWGLFAGQESYSLGPDGYGKNFFFSSRVRQSGPFMAWMFRAGFILLTTAITKIPPLRNLATKTLFPPGTGPSEEQRRGNHFTYRTVAIPDQEGTSRRVEVKFAYQGDPYVFTGVSLTEAALVLLEGGTPAHQRGGILTSAMLGDKFVERLKGPQAGVEIEIKVVEE